MYVILQNFTNIFLTHTEVTEALTFHHPLAHEHHGCISSPAMVFKESAGKCCTHTHRAMYHTCGTVERASPQQVSPRQSCAQGWYTSMMNEKSNV